MNDPSFVIGAKYPNSISEGSRPVMTKAMTPDENSFKGGYNKLLKHIMPAPDQEDAGSCLFMSHTGTVEWWYSKLNKRIRNTEKKNLSERYFMNLSKEGLDDDLNYWPTDMIYALNKRGEIYLNSDYPYAKGWYKKAGGKRIPAREDEEGAKYGISYSWMSMYQDLTAPLVKLPEFEREIIFKDPSENRWNVTTAPKDIVTKIKNMIKKRNAPVIAIYNHVGYWHATMIVGFNDNTDSKNCPFVSKYDKLMNKRADEINVEASEEEDPKKKKKLLRKALKFRKRGTQVATSLATDGGCSGKGVFYVRDSIYPNESMPLYDYDPATDGEEEHLNAPVILREYEWAEQLLNHAYQIYPL
ncbi:hypothetical protein A9Q84_13550 [Halobacteriovorax marinus]|uniref:Uncharacterized protein n=1 Tax=Halobacteriovorax marinus TaxID=97084 RepID=A0A1Y5F978_9BACT|nr:hypothetical protein A9Q84_13550 [Halobacteriovorax marinus]